MAVTVKVLALPTVNVALFALVMAGAWPKVTEAVPLLVPSLAVRVCAPPDFWVTVNVYTPASPLTKRGTPCNMPSTTPR